MKSNTEKPLDLLWGQAPIERGPETAHQSPEAPPGVDQVEPIPTEGEEAYRHSRNPSSKTYVRKT